MMRAVLLVLVLSGCTSVEYVPVREPCTEATPQRPDMALDSLTKPFNIDRWAQAAIIEIEKREAYEIELSQALENCKR